MNNRKLPILLRMKEISIQKTMYTNPETAKILKLQSLPAAMDTPFTNSIPLKKIIKTDDKTIKYLNKLFIDRKLAH
ncbi:MAG: hypothetical protein A2161_09910 [Candidatus Schekmanbacteria bacterium RBG_13_48_7]|uniref:Uncharacterized protein n=1 Tax=Candidatus Schekmanbacteria bacterium RBG_13_48_7 TaxID=1817878 RepID=A0A1F7RMB0_9BACT|nr:MAG: hypothetical protein A2161_09910 [Candidatus Schekmanbacteria bacterium RBG_13_48_7]